MWPEHWRMFVVENDLVWKSVEIPEDMDVSGVGASIEIFDEKSTIEEATDAYPGLGVRKDGYIPVGGCQLGSGDPFFIREGDPPPGPLYQILHDDVFEDGYDPERAISRVLDSYHDLLKFVES